jgi:uncharacterized protein
MNRFTITIVSGILLVAAHQVASFAPAVLSRFRRNGNHGRLAMVPPPDAPSGSFFNRVPSEDDNASDDDRGKSNAKHQASASQDEALSNNHQVKEEDEPTPDSLDDEVTQLLRNRKKPTKASQPSTINGVPTEKASGFGKTKAPATKKPASKKPYVAIGPQSAADKPLNDPTNPEYDDQGFTLYSDEETGKKSRVFEALVEYPCDFTMKIVGANEGAFVEEMVAVVAESCETHPSKVNHTTRAMGKWMSVTVQAPVQNAEMLYALYEKVDLDPRVKFKF